MPKAGRSFGLIQPNPTKSDLIRPIRPIHPICSLALKPTQSNPIRPNPTQSDLSPLADAPFPGEARGVVLLARLWLRKKICEAAVLVAWIKEFEK